MRGRRADRLQIFGRFVHRVVILGLDRIVFMFLNVFEILGARLASWNTGRKEYRVGRHIGTDNGLPVVPKLGYAKLLPKYFQATIEKVEFDLGPANSVLKICDGFISNASLVQFGIDCATRRTIASVMGGAERTRPTDAQLRQ
jgi:hypothetical protein